MRFGLLGFVLLQSGLFFACAKSGGRAFLACNPASSWATADSFQSAAGQNATGLKITADASGNLYSSGKAENGSGVGVWTVRVSHDAGSSWTSLDSFQYATGHAAFPYGMTVAASGLFAVGAATDSGGVSRWVVRKSADGGASWTTVDDYQLIAGQNAQAQAIASDASGDLFTVGYAFDVLGFRHWIARKSADGGVTWSTVDSYQLLASNDSSAGDIKYLGASLYAVGWGTDVAVSQHWIVRKSSDGGTTWTTIDNYQLSSGLSANAQAVDQDGNGNVFVAGFAGSLTTNHWIVRKSGDAGTVWTTVDDASHTSFDSYANSFGRDAFGNLFTAGYYTDTGGKNHWLIRESADGGLNWADSDDFQQSTGQSSQAVALSSHGNGTVVITGVSTDTGGKTHWVMRELGCQ